MIPRVESERVAERSHGRRIARAVPRASVDFHPGMIAVGLLCAFAAVLLSALVVTCGEPAATEARASRADLVRQEAINLAPAESRR